MIAFQVLAIVDSSLSCILTKSVFACISDIGIHFKYVNKKVKGSTLRLLAKKERTEKNHGDYFLGY